MVILAGGATHAPIVTELLKGMFLGKQVNKSIDSDQVVIVGAALLAKEISGD